MGKAILQEGKNCWKIADFSRVALLVDAAAFYEAFARVAEEAKESILIVAWDVDWPSCFRSPAPLCLRSILIW